MVVQQRFSFERLRHERFESVLNDSFFKEVQERWGLRPNTRICSFRFQLEEDHFNGVSNHTISTSINSNNSGGSVLGSLRFSGFHKGLLQEFLSALFDSTIVRETLGVNVSSHHSHSGGLIYNELSCNWITLDPFKRLMEAGVVRCVESNDKDNAISMKNNNNNNKNNNMDNNIIMDNYMDNYMDSFDGVRMPIVKRGDIYLPHDIPVTDELRALFLFVHNTAVCRNDDDEDDDMNNDMFSYSAATQIPISDLRLIFNNKERKEFLYHIIWRFVAGGGTNNQWDEDFTIYLEAARMWYKSLVTIRAIPLKDSTIRTNDNNNNNNTDDGDSAMDEPDREVDVENTTLIPEVISTVVSVQEVSGLRLFPRSDEAEPSNLNYCYVCINPGIAEVVIWYHCF